MNLKKLFIYALTVLLLIPTFVTAKTFSDVDQTGGFSWIYKEVSYLADENILDGYPDGTFKPNKPVSFLEVSQIMFKVLRPSSVEVSEALSAYGSVCNKYDVPEWAKTAVAYMLKRGAYTEATLNEAKRLNMINGSVYPDRNSVTVYIGRALGFTPEIKDSLLFHNDLSEIPQMVREYLSSLVRENIYSSTGSDGFFNGKKFIRRSEMAVISYKTLNYLNTKGASENTVTVPDRQVEFEGIVEDVKSISPSEYIVTLRVRNSNFDFNTDTINFIYKSTESINKGDTYKFKGVYSEGVLKDITLAN